MRALNISIIAIGIAALAGCGGGSGAEIEPNPIVTQPPVAAYTGPAPQTAEVQSFKLNVWDNLNATNRCGACHTTAGQSPTFVRMDDVNLAYGDANPLVNLGQPNESLMVTKVAGGHNCWLTSDAACADILTTWITSWAGAAVGGGGREIELVAPPVMEVGASKSFPDDSALFASTVLPLLQTYCADCHSSDGTVPQQPYFAGMDADVAYAAARSKINLDTPAESRLVLRLRNEFHNCWDDCGANSNEMEAALVAFANPIPLTEIDPALVTSKALRLVDGTVASGGSRYEANVISIYEFKTGGGNTAFDTSGVEPAANLTLSGDVDWLGGWGLTFRGGKAQSSTTSSKKLNDLLKATGEFSIEAWLIPANVTQEDSHILGFSAGTMARNFTLGQTLYNYDFMIRSSATDANGAPALSTADADEDLQATLQHVVATYDPVNGRRIYVNGEFTGDLDDAGGDINDWDDTFAFVLGNEVSGDRPWLGAVRLAAIHNRALTDTQIQQNFDAGVGEKFFLLFGVSEQTGVPAAYVYFEVSRFDEYSYLFSEPKFVSLDGTAQPGGVPIKGIRIGVNGAEAPVGQAFETVDVTVGNAEYTPAGVLLSRLGTIIALDKGPEADEFFLSFEVLGSATNVRTPPAVLQPGPPADLDAASEIGIRTFAEIDATLSVVTGISQFQPDVRDTYLTIEQQLPTVESIEGFLASHQVAIAQLAIEYCNALVEDGSARAAFFPGLNFGSTAAAAFGSTADRDLLLDPLLAASLGSNVATQPAAVDAKLELNALIDRLTTCGNSCSADRTEIVAKAVCAGALGSGAILIH